MTAPADRPNPSVCCLPGDITVTKVPSGYLIGRALPDMGPGPWWEYVAVLSTFTEAVTKALALAEAKGTKAWLHKMGDDYEPLEPKV